jgi:transposase
MRSELNVLSADRPRADDPTVQVSAKVETVTDRLWTYIRQDHPSDGKDPPATFFEYSRTRTGNYPRTHLASWLGIMQADAFSGFDQLYTATRTPTLIAEAGCWAHWRRKFFDKAKLAKAPIAIEAVRRMDEIFEVGRAINDHTPASRVIRRLEFLNFMNHVVAAHPAPSR